jgi:hypothetical protein
MTALLNILILFAVRIIIPFALILFIGEKVRKQQHLQTL